MQAARAITGKPGRSFLILPPQTNPIHPSPFSSRLSVFVVNPHETCHPTPFRLLCVFAPLRAPPLSRLVSSQKSEKWPRNSTRQRPSRALRYWTHEHSRAETNPYPSNQPLAANHSAMSRNRNPKQTPSAAVPPRPDRSALPPWLPVGDRLEQTSRGRSPRHPKYPRPRLSPTRPRSPRRTPTFHRPNARPSPLARSLRSDESGRSRRRSLRLAATLKTPEKMIDHHLNLVAAKSQTTELLIKLRLVNEALARSARPPSLPSPSTLPQSPTPPQSRPHTPLPPPATTQNPNPSPLSPPLNWKISPMWTNNTPTRPQNRLGP